MKIFFTIIICSVMLVCNANENYIKDTIPPSASGDKPFENREFYCGETLYDPLNILFLDDNPSLEYICRDFPFFITFYPNKCRGTIVTTPIIQLENFIITYNPEQKRTKPYLIECDTGYSTNVIPSDIKGEFHAILDYPEEIGPKSDSLKNYGYCKIIDLTPPSFSYYVTDSKGNEIISKQEVISESGSQKEVKTIICPVSLNEKTRYNLNIIFKDNIKYYYDGNFNPSEVEKMSLSNVYDNHIYFAGIKPDSTNKDLSNYDQYDRYDTQAKRVGENPITIQFIPQKKGNYTFAIMIEDMAGTIPPCSDMNNTGYYDLQFNIIDTRINY